MKTRELRNPALSEIASLEGEWTMELFNASFLPDPAAKAQMIARFEWLAGGAALIDVAGR